MPNHPHRYSLLILAVAVLFLTGWYWNTPQPPIDGDYRSELDIPYRVPDAQAGELKDRCRLDLYVPVVPKNFATVVWFHGGGLTQGNKSIPQSLQGQGIAVVAPNYRLSPDAKSPEYVEDAAAAVAWT